ncbi:osmotically-inducible protein OsmY [Paraburkholderia fungorum]|uniref:BON domain-containing protein n=1 Tax=Paraburkholderia fungorum TaxID=134537 RepID=UPI00161C21EC|nr:BON domain-containing protein [Paraburkholderia fungorum]MBB4519715.1 osmotically-inducible protein OsmY [Paraburkholderia fungorum]
MKLNNIVRIALSAASLTWAYGAVAQPADSGSATQATNSASSVRVTDTTLRRQVKAALKKTQGLTAYDIAVRAKNGQVTLQGSVKNQAQIDLAGKVASGVQGVASVKNSLTVNRPNNSWH